MDTDALLAELHSGRLRAAVDVTDPEPLPAGHPLWSAPGLLLTPHVAGEADLIAIVRVREFEQVAEVIAGRINKVPGVIDTDTHIAFRAYSRHDLEAAFSIGFETAD